MDAYYLNNKPKRTVLHQFYAFKKCLNNNSSHYDEKQLKKITKLVNKLEKELSK